MLSKTSGCSCDSIDPDRERENGGLRPPNRETGSQANARSSTFAPCAEKGEAPFDGAHRRLPPESWSHQCAPHRRTFWSPLRHCKQTSSCKCVRSGRLDNASASVPLSSCRIPRVVERDGDHDGQAHPETIRRQPSDPTRSPKKRGPRRGPSGFTGRQDFLRRFPMNPTTPSPAIIRAYAPGSGICGAK